MITFTHKVFGTIPINKKVVIIMNRILELENKIHVILTRINELPPVYIHIRQVSFACALIALKRGENAELATMAGLLHDIASLKKHDIEPFRVHDLTPENHAEKGAAIAMEMLLDMNITTPQENEIICSAIRKHSNKNVIDSPFDEVLKDADVFAHGISNIDSRNFRGYRWDKVCQEFGIDNLR